MLSLYFIVCVCVCVCGMRVSGHASSPVKCFTESLRSFVCRQNDVAVSGRRAAAVGGC